MNALSFDRIKLIASQLGLSPIGIDVSSDTFSSSEDIEATKALVALQRNVARAIKSLRASSGRWLLDCDREDQWSSPVDLLATGGVTRFMSDTETDPSDEEVRENLQYFLTDIVRVEWQFAQLVGEKPEHTESYTNQLRSAYSSIVDRMKDVLENLSWVSRTAQKAFPALAA